MNPQDTDTQTPVENRRVFYRVTIILLLMAVTAVLIKLKYVVEFHWAMPARAEIDPWPIIRIAERWQIAGLVLAALAIVTWIISVCRREKHFSWVPAIGLLMLYIGLELIIM